MVSAGGGSTSSEVGVSFIESLIRQLMNSSERISPCPVSSTLNTSIVEVLSLLRTLHTPSPVIVAFRTAVVRHMSWKSMNGKHLQSSKEAAKLMHMFPSQVPLPCLFTVEGIDAVSSSSIR